MLKKTTLLLALSLTVPAAATVAETCQPIKSGSSLKSGLPVPTNFTAYSNLSDVTNRFIERKTHDMPQEDAEQWICDNYAFSYILYMSSEKELSRICSNKKNCENISIILSVMTGNPDRDITEAKFHNAIRQMGINERDISTAISNADHFMKQYQEPLLLQFVGASIH